MITGTLEPRREPVLLLEAVHGLTQHGPNTAFCLPSASHRGVNPHQGPCVPSSFLSSHGTAVARTTDLVCLNAWCLCSTFTIKNGCLNVPSTPCPRASKWSLHWPAGPRRNHRAPPYRHSHRPPPTAKTPNWHRLLELASGVSRPAQETICFGLLRPWSSAPCI